jgi:translation elongation factor EF-1beta
MSNKERFVRKLEYGMGGNGMATKKELEARLTLQQRKAAVLLVENDLELPDRERMSLEELAQEIKVSRMSLYRWRTQDKDFIDYVNLIADDFFEAKRSFAYRQLMKSISGDQPSVKALDLYFKRFGLLSEVHRVETEVINRSNEDILLGMKELDLLIEAPEEEGEKEEADTDTLLLEDFEEEK